MAGAGERMRGRLRHLFARRRVRVLLGLVVLLIIVRMVLPAVTLMNFWVGVPLHA